MASYARDTRTVPFTLTGTGTLDGQTIAFTGSGNIASLIVAGTFEAMPAQVKTLTTTGTFGAQGVSVPLTDTSVVFYDSNFKPVGSLSEGGYCVTSGTAALPASVKVGDTGAWYAATCYTSRTKSVRVGITTLSYAIESSTATSAVLRITTKVTPQTGAVITQDLTYTITTAGTVGARETPFVGTSPMGIAVNLVFKYL